MFKKAVGIFRKIRKYGIVRSCQIILGQFRYFYECRIPWPLRLRSYYRLMKIVFAPRFRKKRILGIWDFKALPWSIGDPLVFIEKLSILRIEHNAEEIDICVVYDRDNPIGNRGRWGGHNITSDNAQDYMLEFLPLFSTCPYLGSIYQFNSRKEFDYFLRSNFERYDVFPPLGQNLGETYNFVGGEPHSNEIQEFYNAHGYIPHLRIGDRDSSWAQWFYLNHLPDKAVPVTLSLKQTSHRVDRNADPAVWLSFIDKCRTDFPEVVFVVVGLREELFDGLRERANVIIAKDFGTSMVEDLSLIRTSLLHMGSATGVNVIAMFSDIGYLIFQSPNVDKYGLKTGENFSFATDRQKIFGSTIPVTPGLLLNEFREIYSKLDRNEWLRTTLEGARNKQGHPSARVEGKQ